MDTIGTEPCVHYMEGVLYSEIFGLSPSADVISAPDCILSQNFIITTKSDIITIILDSNDVVHAEVDSHQGDSADFCSAVGQVCPLQRK